MNINKVSNDIAFLTRSKKKLKKAFKQFEEQPDKKNKMDCRQKLLRKTGT